MKTQLCRLLAGIAALFLAGGHQADAAFGLSSTNDSYQVDTGAGLVFKVRRTDNGSSTQSPGDLMSLVYNGVEYQNQARGSQVTSGFDYLYSDTSEVSVEAETVGAEFVKITVTAGDLTHYYMARNGFPHIYMGTYFTSEPDIHNLVRYIVRIPEAKLPNGPTPSDIRNTDFTVESGDIFGFSGSHPDAALRGHTRSKHYSNMRLKDWSYIGATGTGVGVWMLRDNHEGGSGGPFYRSLLMQTGSDQEITYIVNYGQAQTEAYRPGILNRYTLVFNNGTAPDEVDTSWLGQMALLGYVAPADRGGLSCPGIRNRDTSHEYTVGFANPTAQYWADADPADGAFSLSGMIPGTYTLSVYKNEIAVETGEVTVTAGETSAIPPIFVGSDPSDVVPLWRIGDWDGTPQEFLNGDKVTTMHPSDVRMADWNPGPYIVGSSSPATGIPCYQWKEINGTQDIRFELTEKQIVDSTIRVGITVAYSGARPNIRVNSWTSRFQGPSTQPGSRSLTTGSYRGNNTTYSFSVPASALVVGTNTLSISPISGSGLSGFLSAGYSFDCIDMFPSPAPGKLPTAYLPFDETSGTIAPDATGNGWDGTLAGGPALTSGRLGNAIDLDGIDDHVTLPAGVVGGLNDFTIATWVKLDSIDAWSRLFDFGSSTSSYLYLTPANGATGNLRFAITKTGGSGEQRIEAPGPLPTGRWTHVAVTLAGTTGTLYLDGEAVAGNPSMTLSPGDLGTTTNNYIGRSQYPDPYLDGQVDEFQIFSRALDADELAALAGGPPAPTGIAAAGGHGEVTLTWNAVPGAHRYTLKRSTSAGGPFEVVATDIIDTRFIDRGLEFETTYYYVLSTMVARTEGGTSEPVSATTLERPLVAHLKFDESEGRTAFDSSPNHNDGTLVGAPVWTTGQFGNALELDGIDDHVTLPAGVTANLDDFTIAAWVKLDSSDTWSRVFDFGSDTSRYMFLTPRNGVTGTVRFAITLDGSDGESFIDGPAPLPSNRWTHVAVTLAGSTGTLYIDGEAVGTNNAMALTPADLGSTPNNYIGNSQWPDPLLDGLVDEFQIHDRALSAVELAGLAEPPPPTEPPAAPGGIAASPGDGRVELTWNPVSGAESYTIYRSTTSGGGYTALAGDLSTPGYTDHAVTNGMSYYYVVTASNEIGESSYSGEVSATPQVPAPGAPADLTATPGDGEVALAWSAAAGADHYRVKRADSNGGPYTTIADNHPATSFTDSGLEWGATYFYVVSAVNAAGEGPDSPEATATLRPAAPGGLTASAGDAEVALAWEASSGATTYSVKRATVSGGPYATIADGIGATNYTDGSVTNGTSYYYVVCAGNASGSSPESAEASATPQVPPPAAPTELVATAGAARISLAWSAPPDATSHLVQRSSTSGGPYQTIADGLASPAYVDEDLNPDTAYYYVVRAVNAGGQSATSNEAGATPFPAAEFSGRAYGLGLQALVLEATWEDTGELPSEGGAAEVSFQSVEEPGLLAGEIGHALVIGQADRTRAEVSVSEIVIDAAGVIVEADFAMSRALAVYQDGGKTAVAGGAEIGELVVAGFPVPVTGQPNQVVGLPNGNLIVNEQIATDTSITVNALHLVLDDGSDLVVSSARAGYESLEPPPIIGDDRVSGGGWIAGPDNKKRNFSLSGGYQAGVLTGHLNFKDRDTGMKVKATDITAYLQGPTANSRRIEGTAEIDDVEGFTFVVEAEDNGEPGDADTFSIDLSNGYHAAGALGGGNIQLHRPGE